MRPFFLFRLWHVTEHLVGIGDLKWGSKQLLMDRRTKSDVMTAVDSNKMPFKPYHMLSITSRLQWLELTIGYRTELYPGAMRWPDASMGSNTCMNLANPLCKVSVSALHLVGDRWSPIGHALIHDYRWCDDSCSILEVRLLNSSLIHNPMPNLAQYR